MTGYRKDPIGISATGGLMLSWAIDDAGAAGDLDGGFEVRVSRTPDAEAPALWRTAGVTSSAIRYDGPAIGSRDVRYWRVEATAADGTVVRSPAARFEVGLEHDEDWAAEWVSAPPREQRRESWEPVPRFRQRFAIRSQVSSARAYVTALGIYRLWINGVEITGDQLLRPGWTDYRRRVYHQTYDVTEVLRVGDNVVAAELASGWYAGRLGLQQEPGYYGDQTALRCQIEVDGAIVTRTDEGWRWAEGDVLATALIGGETQDLRLREPDWTLPGFDDSSWSGVQARHDVGVDVVPQSHSSVERHSELEGELVFAHAWGPLVFDFGQNVVGWVRVEAHTLSRADVIVRHAETLTSHRRLWRDNLRTAAQEDRYTTGDGRDHSLEPRYTVHGFRFAEVWGLPATVGDAVPQPRATAIALGGGQRPVGSFSCSDDELTRLSGLIEWTVRDNTLEVFTDCPQRDERLGWLGDAGVIAPTAAYYFDLGAFLAKVSVDIADGLAPDGMVPPYVPWVPGTNPDGAPGWSDGFVRLVHLAAERYGDTATARSHYDALSRFIELIDRENPTGLRTHRVGDDFGDWLSLPVPWTDALPPGPAGFTGAWSTSSRRVLGTAQFIRSLDQMTEIAEWLGHSEDAARWRARAQTLRRTYAESFLDAEGRIESDTQTVHAQALAFDLLDERSTVSAARRLAEIVREVGHVTTGIMGVQHLLPALTRNGFVDEADAVLQRGGFPGWKHMLRNGATTIWEKWDGIREDGTRATPVMNSFNHPALGAIGAFLFETVAGLNTRTAVWDRTLLIEPAYLPSLTWARAEHVSVCGPTSSGWERRGDRIEHRFEVPSGMKVVYRAPRGYHIDDASSASLTFGAGSGMVVVRGG